MTSANEGEIKANGEKETGFYERFVALPIVSEAISQTTNAYQTVKSRNSLTQYACDTGESVVKRVTTTAYNVGTPIADLALKVAEPYVGNPVACLDHVAAQTLVKCEQTFPIITKHPNDIISSTVGAIKGKADDCYNAVNNFYVVQFTHARVNEAISLSELAVEVLLPSDPSSPEDVSEQETESQEIKNASEGKEQLPLGNTERVLALGKRIRRRGGKKLMSLKPVQFTYEQMITVQQNMTNLIHRSQEAGKTVHQAVLTIPSLAIQLTGEAVVNAKALVIAFHNTYSLKDIPGSVASFTGQIAGPVSNATGHVLGKLLLPPKLIAAYILSSRPIQCFVPNVVVFEEISKMDIEMDELASDSTDGTDQMEDDLEEPEK